jgi:hypothetical protein
VILELRPADAVEYVFPDLARCGSLAVREEDGVIGAAPAG